MINEQIPRVTVVGDDGNVYVYAGNFIVFAQGGGTFDTHTYIAMQARQMPIFLTQCMSALGELACSWEKEAERIMEEEE